MAAGAISRQGEFDVTASDHALGMILPQRLGTKLWIPMLLMGAMAFPVAFVLGAIRASLVADLATTSDAANAAALGQYVPAVMFLGFASIFAAIVFAIGRILGTLRVGGGQVQESTGRQVLTLQMPGTAKVMLLMMMMAMMMLLFAVVAHVVLGIVVHDAVQDGDLRTIGSVGSWSTWLEGLRRFGAALYLVSIAFGLATIVQVLRFQSARIRQLPDEQTRSSAG